MKINFHEVLCPLKVKVFKGTLKTLCNLKGLPFKLLSLIF